MWKTLRGAGNFGLCLLAAVLNLSLNSFAQDTETKIAPPEALEEQAKETVVEEVVVEKGIVEEVTAEEVVVEEAAIEKILQEKETEATAEEPAEKKEKIIREKISNAEYLIKEGDRLYEKMNYEEAYEIYKEALKSLK